MRIPIGFAGLGGGADISVPLENAYALAVPINYAVAAAPPGPLSYDPSTWCVSPNTGQAGPCSLMQQMDPSAMPLLPLTLGDVLLRCHGMTTDNPCSISGPAPCDPLITAGAGLRCSGGGGPYVTYYGPTEDPMNITAVNSSQRAYLESQGLVDSAGTPIPNAPIPTVGPAAATVSSASPDTAQQGGLNLAGAPADTTSDIIPGIPNLVTIGGGAALVMLLLKL